MCGRYTLTTPGEALAELFELPSVPELVPRYNVAPTQEVAAIRAAGGGPSGDDGDGGREFARLRWGLVPHWAKDPAIGNRMINARSETAAEKPAYRDAFKRRRCLVLADGFFEWQKVPGSTTKQPHYIRLASGEPFAFAGLWSRWTKGDEPLETCALLTTSPNPLVRPIHDRMPVILSPGEYDLWLDPTVSDRDRLQPLLDPYVPEEMIAYPVSTLVNKPANDLPAVLDPVDGIQTAGGGEIAEPESGGQGELF